MLFPRRGFAPFDPPKGVTKRQVNMYLTYCRGLRPPRPLYFNIASPWITLLPTARICILSSLLFSHLFWSVHCFLWFPKMLEG